jgi:hypothetical protein
MISMTHVWIPLLLSAVLVFIASSLVHMVFKWHNADYLKLGNEDEVRAAIRKTNAGPGYYVIPHCLDMKEMQSPEMQKKFKDGPVGFLTLRQPGLPAMGGHLAKWFALNLLIAAVVACIAATTLPVGAVSGRVFHVTALITFIAYGAGAISDGIWKGEPWKSVAKDLLDALIYAGVTGAAFAWLWPH